MNDASLLTGGIDCKVSPLVVFSVLEHYMRRNEGQERVIGTLLGTNNDGVLEISNCFPVPHEEKDAVGIDMDFLRTLFALFRQSNPTEIILGWYTTGTEINDHSILIHDFFGREIQRPPVHLCVGTDLRSGSGVELQAYMGTSVALKERVFGSHFARLPLALASSDSAERAVLLAALAGKPASPAGSEVLAGLTALRAQLEGLLAHARGAQTRDAAAGRALQRALLRAPAKELAAAA